MEQVDGISYTEEDDARESAQGPDLSTSWHGYPKSLAVGHRYLTGIFEDDVTITEKIDGSQFSFGVFKDRLRCRSKGQQINLDAPDKMFIKAVETVKEIAGQLAKGYTYRAEYLNKPKHNVLAYDRVPEKYLIIFDIARGHEDYLSYGEMAQEAEEIGLECVPLIFHGKVTNVDFFLGLLERDSVLGGQKIEGVVAKNYDRFGKDGKILMAKYVSEKFKEVHNKDWKTKNPSGIDVVTKLGLQYHSEARFAKAVQHLKEEGVLLGEPKDIGNLIKEIKRDVLEECGVDIKEALFKWAYPKIDRMITAGFPEWYKHLLVEETFIVTED
jgi:hypothetical protein